jgi:Polyketide cyclase / dehydrase and lipid transport
LRIAVEPVSSSARIRFREDGMKILARMMVAAGAMMSLSGCLMVHEEKVASAPPPPIATVAPAPVAAPPPSPPAPPPVSVFVANPTYASIPMEITVNKPAAEVWKRVGKYCDIAEWLQIATGCTITAGKDGEIGAVRTVGSEILVGKTELSYTYTQPARDGRPYNLYHGTLEARPINARTSKLVYTLMFDNSMLADDAARTADLERRRTAFTRALNNMKILAEGGTLPPPPPRPAAAPAPAAPATPR